MMMLRAPQKMAAGLIGTSLTQLGQCFIILIDQMTRQSQSEFNI